MSARREREKSISIQVTGATNEAARRVSSAPQFNIRPLTSLRTVRHGAGVAVVGRRFRISQPSRVRKPAPEFFGCCRIFAMRTGFYRPTRGGRRDVMIGFKAIEQNLQFVIGNEFLLGLLFFGGFNWRWGHDRSPLFAGRALSFGMSFLTVQTLFHFDTTLRFLHYVHFSRCGTTLRGIDNPSKFVAISDSLWMV